MLKLFAIVAAAVGLTAAGAAVAGHHYYDPNQPAPAELSRACDRHHATCDVIDGRLSLLEAAAIFRDLNDQTPVLADVLAHTYPADTEQERACLHVIAFVRAELHGRSQDAGASSIGETAADLTESTLARLRAQLALATGKGGKVRLPADAD